MTSELRLRCGRDRRPPIDERECPLTAGEAVRHLTRSALLPHGSGGGGGGARPLFCAACHLPNGDALNQ